MARAHCGLGMIGFAEQSADVPIENACNDIEKVSFSSSAVDIDSASINSVAGNRL